LLPFSGGHRYSYEPLVRALPQWIEAVPIELPGHGGRFREPLLTDIPSMAEDVVRHLSDVEPPYSLFGHSLGARLAYEVAVVSRVRGLPAPIVLFASGAAAPGAELDKIRHGLTDEELAEELRALGGTPAGFFEKPELRELFVPLIRADFRAAETYSPPDVEPLDVPIHTLGGDREPISTPAREAWAGLTSRGVEMARFPGNHFFVLSQAPQVAEYIVRVLSDALEQRG
jgi:surfactin synthase thioesterase subunit